MIPTAIEVGENYFKISTKGENIRLSFPTREETIDVLNKVRAALNKGQPNSFSDLKAIVIKTGIEHGKTTSTNN